MKKLLTIVLFCLLFLNCSSYLSLAQIQTLIGIGCKVRVIDERQMEQGRLYKVRFTCPEKCCSCEEYIE